VTEPPTDLHGLSEYEQGRELAHAEQEARGDMAARLAPLRRQWSVWWEEGTRGGRMELWKLAAGSEDTMRRSWASAVTRSSRSLAILIDPDGVVVEDWRDSGSVEYAFRLLGRSRARRKG